MQKFRVALFVAAMMSSTSALAQSAMPRNAPAIEEVTVTAQRREESLQKVPIAITAFTATALENKQISRTIDIVNFVPNLEGHNNTGLGTANTYSLRGLNNTESIATFDPPVGTYVDEVFVARQNANNFSFYDIDRIEVLRGPQGTLFGRNTTGGAINVIMKKPAPEFGGFAEVGYGEYSRRQVRASIDAPVAPDKVLTKLSGYYVEDDGYVKNQTTGEDINAEKSWGIRGAVRLLMSSAFTWDISADYDDSNYANLINFRNAATGDRVDFTRQSLTHGLGTQYVSAGLANIPLGNDTRATSVISNLAWQTDYDLTLNWISGYRYLEQDFMTDSFDSLSSPSVVYAPDTFSLVSAKPGTSTPLVNAGRHTQYTEELKGTGRALGGRLDYVAGLYWFHDENTTSFANINIPLIGSATVTQDRTMDNQTDAYAAYAQFDYHVTKALTATAGLRYTDEIKDIQFRPNPNPLPRSAPLNQPFTTADVVKAGIPIELKANQLTPRFALDYQVTDDFMAFASATRGFKSGGWNARANYGALALPFKPEKVWTEEAGFRSDWLNHRLRWNVTAFYMDVKDFQLPAGYADPISNTVIFVTRNFADLENHGIESELTAALTDRLHLTWAAGFQHARYHNVNSTVLAQAQRCASGISPLTNCNNGIVTPTGGIALPVRAPDFSSTVGLDYNFDVTRSIDATPSANWTHVNGHFVGTANTPISFSKTRDVMNAGISFRDSEHNLTLSFDCTNCTNVTYVVSYLVFPYLDEPRRWMVHLRKDF